MNITCFCCGHKHETKDFYDFAAFDGAKVMVSRSFECMGCGERIDLSNDEIMQLSDELFVSRMERYALGLDRRKGK